MLYKFFITQWKYPVKNDWVNHVTIKVKHSKMDDLIYPKLKLPNLKDSQISVQAAKTCSDGELDLPYLKQILVIVISILPALTAMWSQIARNMPCSVQW